MLTLALSLSLVACLGTSQPFVYQVRIQTKDTLSNVSNAKVTIDVGGSIAPLDTYTDNNGVALVQVDASRLGRTGRLIVDAVGYKRAELFITLTEGALPQVIRLEAAAAVASTLSPSDTLSATTSPSEEKIVAELTQSVTLVYSDSTGVLTDTDGAEEFKIAPVDLNNLIVEVLFYNPNYETNQKWSYGIAFRRAKSTQKDNQFVQYQFYVKPNNSTWFFQKVERIDGEFRNFSLARGVTPNINQLGDRPNQIRVVVSGEKAYFVVNKQIVGKVENLGELQHGSALIEVGFETTNAKEGIRYENFQVWSIN